MGWSPHGLTDLGETVLGETNAPGVSGCRKLGAVNDCDELVTVIGAAVVIRGMVVVVVVHEVTGVRGWGEGGSGDSERLGELGETERAPKSELHERGRVNACGTASMAPSFTFRGECARSFTSVKGASIVPSVSFKSFAGVAMEAFFWT